MYITYLSHHEEIETNLIYVVHQKPEKVNTDNLVIPHKSARDTPVLSWFAAAGDEKMPARNIATDLLASNAAFPSISGYTVTEAIEKGTYSNYD